MNKPCPVCKTQVLTGPSVPCPECGFNVMRKQVPEKCSIANCGTCREEARAILRLMEEVETILKWNGLVSKSQLKQAFDRMKELGW